MWADERHTQKRIEMEEVRRDIRGRGEVKESWIDKIASMRWTGLTRLSDEEYAGMLGEKVLKIEAEVAIIEEEIEKLRDEEREKQRVIADQSRPAKQVQSD